MLTLSYIKSNFKELFPSSYECQELEFWYPFADVQSAQNRFLVANSAQI